MQPNNCGRKLKYTEETHTNLRRTQTPGPTQGLIPGPSCYEETVLITKLPCCLFFLETINLDWMRNTDGPKLSFTVETTEVWRFAGH